MYHHNKLHLLALGYFGSMLSCFSFLFQMFSMENQQQGVETINPNGQNPNGESPKDNDGVETINPNGQNPNGESPKDNNSAALVQALPMNAEVYSVIDSDSYFDEKFPPGYRFKPYDSELIVHYLQRKIKNEPLPPNRIKEVELYKLHPQALAENYKPLGENEWYFFTPRDRKYKRGKRPNRAAVGGYWKATGADKNVEYKDAVVGSKKALVFYKGKPPRGDKTNWIMHEFRANTPSGIRTHGDDMRLDDWVLCRMYKKKQVQDQSRRTSTCDQDDSFQDDQQSQTEIQDTGANDMAAETFMRQGPGLTDMPGYGTYGNQGRYFNTCDNAFMYPQSTFQNHVGRLPGTNPQYSHYNQGQNSGWLPGQNYSWNQQPFPLASNSNLTQADNSAAAARTTFQPMESNMKHEQIDGLHSLDYLMVPPEDSFFDDPLLYDKGNSDSQSFS